MASFFQQDIMRHVFAKMTLGSFLLVGLVGSTSMSKSHSRTIATHQRTIFKSQVATRAISPVERGWHWCKNHSGNKPPPTCYPTENYEITYDDQHKLSWPFRHGLIRRNDFHNFHNKHWPLWTKGVYFFKNTDYQTLKIIQLQHETVVMKALVRDLETLNDIKISLNGFVGEALNSEAISFEVLSQVQIDGQKEKKRLECGDDIDKAFLVEIKFHLENFVFKMNSSAADIIRSSKWIAFSAFGNKDLLRVVDISLNLKGVSPAVCPPPPCTNPADCPSIPVVSITSTSVGTLTNQPSATIEFKSDVPATFQCSVDSASYVDCQSPFTVSDLSDGIHHFSVIAKNSGGTSEADFFDWTVDSVGSVVTLDVIQPADSPTDFTHMTIQFSANETSTFQCHLDGVFQPCNSPISLNGLADGPHSVTIVGTDIAGNTGSVVGHQWVVKTLPPEVTITAVVPNTNPSNSNFRTYSFVGSGDAVSFVCRLDGGADFSCDSPHTLTTLSEGQHVFEVLSVDVLGHRSPPATESFTIDTQSPLAQIVSTLPSQSPTMSRNIEFVFASNENASFECFIDGRNLGTCSSPQVITGLSHGSHRFSIRATDLAGNQSSEVSYHWVIDILNPLLTVNVEPSTFYIIQTSISFSMIVNEPSTLTCTFDGLTQDCSSGQVVYSGLSEGSHIFSLVARDLAGNAAPTFNYSFRVDLSGPMVQITSTDPVGSPTRSTSMNIVFTSTEPGPFMCSRDGGAFVICSSPLNYTGLSDGSHNVRITANDLGGNPSTNTASHSWVVDTQAPTLQIAETNPASFPTNSQSITFTFAANEPVNYFCRLDSQGFEPCPNPFTLNGVQEGIHRFDVYAQDLAGNTSVDTIRFEWTIDNQRPFTTITSTSVVSPTLSRSVVIGFTANEAATFRCQLDGGAFVPCTNPVTYYDLTVGTHSFRVQSTDLAGNVDTHGATFVWEVLGFAL